MRTAISQPSPSGSFLIVSVPHNVTVAIRPVTGTPSLVDQPQEIFAIAPDLAMLSLAEPPTPAFAPAFVRSAEVTLVYLDTTSGELEMVDEDTASRCGAYVCHPAFGRVEFIEAATLVNLVARGLVIQVLTGVAAAQGARLDDELAQLIDSLPQNDDPAGDDSNKPPLN